MMASKEKTDRELAEALVAALKPYDEMAMLEAEDAIFERLEMPGDQTEQGATAYAVRRVEEFVSASIGRSWTYEESERNE